MFFRKCNTPTGGRTNQDSIQMGVRGQSVARTDRLHLVFRRNLSLNGAFRRGAAIARDVVCDVMNGRWRRFASNRFDGGRRKVRRSCGWRPKRNSDRSPGGGLLRRPTWPNRGHIPGVWRPGWVHVGGVAHEGFGGVLFFSRHRFGNGVEQGRPRTSGTVAAVVT